ncbi:MAG: FAD:protein FMN transferase [Kiritimatiellia bacterium]
MDETFSTYGRDSELARINAAASTNVAVSPPLARLLTLSQAVSAASDGAFDITCGPVLRCWKSTRAAPGRRMRRSSRAAARSGHAFPHVDGRACAGTGAGMEINVNAVAPGLAADLLREWLAERG